MVEEHNFRIIDSGALHVLAIAIPFSFLLSRVCSSRGP